MLSLALRQKRLSTSASARLMLATCLALAFSSRTAALRPPMVRARASLQKGRTARRSPRLRGAPATLTSALGVQVLTVAAPQVAQRMVAPPPPHAPPPAGGASALVIALAAAAGVVVVVVALVAARCLRRRAAGSPKVAAAGKAGVNA